MKMQVCVICALALAACAPPPAPAFDAAAQAQVRDSVTATFRAYEAAIKTLDSAKIVAFYADDSAFRFVQGQRVSGRKELLAGVGGLLASLKRFDGGFAYDSLVIVPLSPNTAVGAGPYVDIMTDTAGTVTRMPGFVTWVLRRDAVGWRFIYAHAAPQPPVVSRK